jgi:hypothetical protein
MGTDEIQRTLFLWDFPLTQMKALVSNGDGKSEINFIALSHTHDGVGQIVHGDTLLRFVGGKKGK